MILFWHVSVILDSCPLHVCADATLKSQFLVFTILAFEVDMMGCPYFEKTGMCGETKTLPGPSYSLNYCSKSEEHYEKCAQFNLKKWKERGSFDLRLIDSEMYTRLRNFDSSQMLRGIVRAIFPRVNKCQHCKDLQKQGKKGLCFIHSFYVQKIAYVLQEIHGFNTQSPLKFIPMKYGPFSEEVTAFLEGQEFLSSWSQSKDDSYGQLGVGGLGDQEQGIFYKLIDRYLQTPKQQLEIFATKHHELSHVGTVDEFDAIVRSLKEKYPNGNEYAKELEIFKEPLTNTLRSISATFEPVEALSVGSSGILVKIRDKSFQGGKEGSFRVLKFPRPRGNEFRIANLKIIQEEKDRLCSLSHDRIVSVVTAGETTYKGLQLPWYIMEFIGPSTDLEEFLKKEQDISFGSLVGLFIDIVSALFYLHDNGIIHCDLKTQNILIKEDKVPIAMITDLGYAHAKSGNGQEMINIRFSLPNAHPFLCKNTTRSSDPSAMTTQLQREQLNANFDLHALGRTIESAWLQITKKLKDKGVSIENHFGKYKTEYVKLVIARLIATGAHPSMNGGGNQLPSLEDYAPGLPYEILTEELSYRDASEVLDDLCKLDERVGVSSLVPELNPFNPKVINLGTKEPKSNLTDRVRRIIDLAAFNRLGSVSQLGLISYVYPGAKHTRDEHAQGAYAQTTDFLRALWQNSNTPLFKSIMRKQDLCATLLASLLHDIGYYPLAHDLEDSEEWHDRIDHESYACRIIDEQLREIISKDWGVNPDYVKRIFLGEQDSFRTKILHSIVDGPIDTDTIDYLIRDGEHLGLEYPKCIDREWLLRNLTIAYGPELGKSGALAVTEKGRVTAESVAFARYMMFSVAYWHHTARAAKAMIKYALGRLADGKEFDANEHYSHFIADTQEAKIPLNAPESISIRKDIAFTDAQQLLWIRERLDDVGKAMIDLLLQRNLFKRIVVLDASRSDTQSVYKFFSKASNRQIRQVREKLEIKLKDWLLQHDKESSYDKLEPLVLIDVPRTQTIPTLYYVSELGNAPLSQSSIVWWELAERFSQSIGKVRIFVHPQIASVLRYSLSRDKLLEILTTIIESPVGYQRG